MEGRRLEGIWLTVAAGRVPRADGWLWPGGQSTRAHRDASVRHCEADQLLLIMVPTPWSVRISREQAVFDAAVDDVHRIHAVAGGVEAEPILGSMPPERVPSATRSSMSRGEAGEQVALPSSTPG